MSFTPENYDPYDFANRRHIGPSPSEMADMFDVLGVKDLDELITGENDGPGSGSVLVRKNLAALLI